MRVLILLLILASPAWADTEYYVCPTILIEEAGEPLRTTPADTLTAGFPETWVTQWFEAAEDAELVVGVTAPPEAHAAVQADGRCELVPGAPLSTELRGAKLGEARAFAARRMPQAAANRLGAAHTKRALVALLSDQLARGRGRTPTWPRKHCRWEGPTWTCDLFDQSSVP